MNLSMKKSTSYLIKFNTGAILISVLYGISLFFVIGWLIATKLNNRYFKFHISALFAFAGLTFLFIYYCFARLSQDQLTNDPIIAKNYFCELNKESPSIRWFTPWYVSLSFGLIFIIFPYALSIIPSLVQFIIKQHKCYKQYE